MKVRTLALVLLTLSANYSSPVVVNGMVFVRSVESTSAYLYAFHLPG